MKRTVFMNTMASYGLLASRLVTAIFLTRYTLHGLGQADFGFWSLLWSVFGYSLLLDFGFGSSIHKHTSEYTVTGDIETYNRVVSTVLAVYLVFSLVIAAVTLGLASALDRIFELPAGGNIAYYKKVFLCFGLGTAIAFPTGAINEALRGLNRIFLSSVIGMVSVLVNAVVIFIALACGYKLMTLVIISLGTFLATNLVMLVALIILIPGVRFRPWNFDFAMLKEICSFSLLAYLITCSNMVIFKTDHMVLGIMLGMEAVAIYQIGSRLPDMGIKLTTQFQDTLRPIAAALHKSGDDERLRGILLQSNRIVAFKTTILFLIASVLISPILYVWLGVTNHTATAIGQLLCLSGFITVLLKSGPANVLLMAGEHKILSACAVAEATLNLAISVLLVYWIGAVGVGWGTLIPAAIINAGFIFPASCRFTRTRIRQQLREVYLPVALASVPALAVLLSALYLIPLKSWNLLDLGIVSALATACYAVGGYFLCLNHEERQTLRNTVTGRRLSSPTA